MVASFSVEVKFDDSYYKKLGLKGEGYEGAVDAGVDHALSDAENIIKREVPRPGHGRGKYYVPVGNLQRSIHKNKPAKCQGELRTNVPYWVYVQYGHGEITPKRGKFLKFKGKDGNDIFVKRVPAQPPNPFVTRTARKIKPKLAEYVMEELKRAGVID